MSYSYVFDSEKHKKRKKDFAIATQKGSNTTVLLPNENLLLKIDKIGRVDFCEADGTLLCAGEVERQSGGLERYEKINLCIIDGILTVDFPIYKWIDNYPHCDGEFDRWSTIIIGYRSVFFSLDLKKCIEKTMIGF